MPFHITGRRGERKKYFLTSEGAILYKDLRTKVVLSRAKDTMDCQADAVNCLQKDDIELSSM